MTEVPPNEILDVPCKTVSLTRFFDPANFHADGWPAPLMMKETAGVLALEG